MNTAEATSSSLPLEKPADHDQISHPTSHPTTPEGMIAGLVSAASGLACGELVSGLFTDLTSPVIGVGNRVVDLVPQPIKRFAISTFGTYDKVALLAGIGSTLVVAAMVVGALGAKRRAIGVVGIGAFGVVGALAATTGRTGSLSDAIPSVVSAAVGVVVFVALMSFRASASQSGQRNPTESKDATSASSVYAGRRGFLVVSAGLAAAATAMAIFGRRLQTATGAATQAARAAFGGAKKPLPPIPASVGAQALVEANPFITPNKDFYRIDTALVVPKVDIEKWSLTINGMVDSPRTFTYEELMSREDLIEQDITLTCVSNEVGGILMGNARWLGIPLKTLLEEAGVQAKASQIVGHSVDGWTSGFPTAVLDNGSDAIVAVGMNGEPLPFDHGFPARLVVPGLYGYVSATKWLNRIEMTTMDAFDAYWVPRGYSKEAPIKLASRIDVPRGLSTIPSGKAAVAGIAWAQTTGISRVEVKIDGGEWQEAKLTDELSIDTWRQWSFEWDAPSGQHDVAVRATDAAGNLQIEERTAPLPNGATGWHSVVVFVS
jgi:DMSO/TMAO reductase YedYZ molybdopterin-dependent catalytic subunit